MHAQPASMLIPLSASFTVFICFEFLPSNFERFNHFGNLRIVYESSQCACIEGIDLTRDLIIGYTTREHINYIYIYDILELFYVEYITDIKIKTKIDIFWFQRKKNIYIFFYIIYIQLIKIHSSIRQFV